MGNKSESELEKFSMKTPCFMPIKSETFVAFYLKSEKDWKRAVYEFCLRYLIPIGNWDPRHESQREDFKKFKDEYKWDKTFVHGGFDEADWYIFQYFAETESYWSEKYGDYMNSTRKYIAVSKLSDVKAKAAAFFEEFDREIVSLY